MPRLLALSAVAAAVVCLSPSAAALDFTPKADANGRAILLVHDRRPCGENDRTCGFSKGDRDRLERTLASRPFYEVWFHSGGGNLYEGVEIGRLLRQRRIKVRVPDGHYCISACTVAFMGGLVRSIDPKGSFQVHSASSVLSGLDPSLQSTLLRDPQLALAQQADANYDRGKLWASTLIGYFQLMLNGRPDETALERVVENGPARLSYVTSGELERDARKIRAEGTMVTQDIIMALERQGIAQAIENVKPYAANLGPRAAPAIKMLETMYTSSILNVAELSPQTLYELGYVNVRVQ